MRLNCAPGWYSWPPGGIPERILDRGLAYVHGSGWVTSNASPHGPGGERHPRGEVCRCGPCRGQMRLVA